MSKLPVDELLARDRELRLLAQRLLANDSDAEDLVQEVYLQALDRDPIPAGTSDRWWRELLRLKARGWRDREERRRRRERVVAIPRDQPLEPVGERDREVFRRDLAQAVLDLGEPYQETLRLRFLEQLPPREIARRLAVPVRTVHTRVTRGLAQLRARLEREYGEERWIACALALWRSGPTRSAPAALPTALMAVLSIAGAALFLHDSATDAPEPDRRVLSISSPSSVSVHGAGRQAKEDPRPALVAGTPRAERVAVPAGSEPVTAAGGVALSGRVVDPSGQPVGGIPVLWEEGTTASPDAPFADWTFAAVGSLSVSGRSAPDGAFHLRIPPGTQGRVLARGMGFRPVLAESVPYPGRHAGLEVVVAPRRRITGRVLDLQGRPLPGATLAMMPSPAFRAGQSRPERSWMPVRSLEAVDSEGRFEIVEAYRMDEAELFIECEGYVPQRVQLDDSGPLDLDFSLQPLAAVAPPLVGVVLDERGLPIADALVAAGEARCRSEADGRFALPSSTLGESEELWALVPGRLPVRRRLERDARGAFAPDPLVLEVLHPSLSIRGRVVDAQGRPVAGALLWCHDMTMAGRGRSSFSVEEMLAAEFTAGPFRTFSDEEGRFEMLFLIEREYRVGALLKASMDQALSEAIPAGTPDLLIHLPTDQVRTPTEGRVLGADGAPIVGASVALCQNTAIVQRQDGSAFASELHHWSVETDTGGRFRFPEFGHGPFLLNVQGPEIMQTLVPFPAPVPGQARQLEIVVGRRARFRVRSHASCPRATRALLVDADGQPVLIYVAAEEVGNQFDRVLYVGLEPEGGAEGTFVCPDTARAMIFYRGSEELCRRAVRLTPGELNDLSF